MKKLFFPVILSSLVFVFSSNAQLLNTGWKRPAAIHFPNDWTTPQEAFGSDDHYAEVLHQSGCRCPFMDLSWDDGTNYSSYHLFGPYGITDSYKTQGDSLDIWGHAWTDNELSDSAFVLRIWNSSTLLRQGYAGFGFGILSGSMISGIEVRVEAHGDSNYTYDRVDIIEVKVYYYLPTTINEVYSSHHFVNVFPNPAQNNIYMRAADDAKIQKVQVLTLQGKVAAEYSFSDREAVDEYAMDVTSLAPGIYFLNILNGMRIVNTRIVIY